MRWPSTELVAKVLAVTNQLICRVRAAWSATASAAPDASVPVIGFASGRRPAASSTTAAFPTGKGWDELGLPGGRATSTPTAWRSPAISMAPAYRDGDVIIVSPLTAPVRRGDRVV